MKGLRFPGGKLLDNNTVTKPWGRSSAAPSSPRFPPAVLLVAAVLDLFIALKTCAGNSRYVVPSRHDADAPMSRATFNRVTYLVLEQAKKDGMPLEPYRARFEADWLDAAQ